VSYAPRMSVDLGELYASSRYRITDLMMSAGGDVSERPCPATPEWSVHDVIAHLRGLTEDVRTGNVSGAGTDPWTAAQVARHRGSETRVLLEGWGEDAPVLEGFLSSPQGEGARQAVVDVHCHEADLRGALGLPAVLPDVFGDWVFATFGSHFIDGAVAGGIPAVRIVTDAGDELGPGDAELVLRAGRFELFRSFLGRRTPAQVSAYDWGGTDPTPYLAHYFIFGPRTSDLIE